MACVTSIRSPPTKRPSALSSYNGNAATQFANLSISGTGFTASLEMDRLDHRVRRCREKTIDLMGPGTGFDFVVIITLGTLHERVGDAAACLNAAWTGSPLPDHLATGLVRRSQ
jgi:hypothetical protein